MGYPRLLIVGTVPYNKQSTSRAFDAYFSNWDKDKLAQVFSDPAVPKRGHCSRFFQITDKRLVQRWLNKDIETGIEYFDENLESDHSVLSKTDEVGSLYKFLYKFGRSHTPLTHLLRKILWRKKFWNTPKFNKWLEDFNPECIFLSFSDDFFILEIALYVAQKFNIPICSSTGDDYYFNTRLTLDPLWYLYHKLYRNLNRKVFEHKGSAIYISDKIRDKYNSEFGLDGETVYLVSDIKQRAFRPIDPENVKVSYFGNISLGRNESLNEIGKAFGKINPKLKIDIYSNNDRKYASVFDGNANVNFHSGIPYSEVVRLTSESDILLIVEGFKKRDVTATKYSLSTKVADSLASGCNIIVYGSPECGAMEYMKSINCATVCHTPEELIDGIKRLLNDVDFQKKNYDKSHEVFLENHSIERSTATVERIVKRLVNENI